MTTVALNDLNRQIFEISWPINSIFITTSDDNPSTIITGGENSVWEKIQDRFLLASGSTYVNGSVGGEATHTLTEAEIPSHKHNFYYKFDDDNTNAIPDQSWAIVVSNTVNAEKDNGVGTYAVGNDQPHNNMPPYLVVNIWKRIG